MSLSQSFYNPQIKPPQWGGTEVMASNVWRWHDLKGFPHPVLYLPMWEWSGDSVFDLSGYNSTGAITIDIAWFLGPAGSSIKSTDSSSGVNVGYGQGLLQTPAGDHTILIWCSHGASSGDDLFSNGAGVAGDMLLQVDASSFVKCHLWTTGGSGIVTDNQVVLLNQEYLVGQHVSGSTITCIYDGEFGQSVAITGTGANANSAFAIGARGPGGSPSWDGNVSQCIVYNDALSQDQIFLLKREPYGALYPVNPPVWSFLSVGAPPTGRPQGPLGHVFKGPLGGPI